MRLTSPQPTTDTPAAAPPSCSERALPCRLTVPACASMKAPTSTSTVVPVCSSSAVAATAAGAVTLAALASPALVLDNGSISLQPSGHGAMAVVTPHALVSTAGNMTINSALAVSGADSLTLAASGTLWV